MEHLKAGAAALNQTPLDWDGNQANIVAAIRQARAEGVQVLCLPELCISGYGCEDAFHGESVAGQSLESLRAILPETRGIAVAVGLPLIHSEHLYNCAALLADGQLAGFFAKKILAGSGVYYEPRWFNAWPAGHGALHPWEGGSVPIGDLVFDLDGVRLSFEICEEAWGRQGVLAGKPDPLAAGVDLLLNPSASHFAFGKSETVRDIVREGSRQSHGVYLYSNLVGNESGRLIFDGITFIASDGKVVAEGPRFSYHPVRLTTAVVDLRANRLERRRLIYPDPISGDHTGGDHTGGGIPGGTESSYTPASGGPESSSPDIGGPKSSTGPRGVGNPAVPVPFTPQWADARAVAEFRAAASNGARPRALSRNEEFAEAVALGLWDYLRKSRSQGFAVSLSGGVDSATVAVLCWVMAHRALEELQPEGVAEALAHVEELGENGGALTPRALVRRLLLTAYQASSNSSRTTRDAAAGVAEAIGARHVDVNIQPMVDQYRELAEQVLGRSLTWESDDIALQNIQARARSPGIWLLANLEGRLLLSTSNRSEVGVGYATMDGDTSGGLAPIAGANKTFLRGWLRWMETEGLQGRASPGKGRAGEAEEGDLSATHEGALGPLPALGPVNAQNPTAELRPPGEAQEDEKDLMPYPVLDAIEQAAIRDRMSPLEVWRTLLAMPLECATPPPRQAAQYVETFFRLWSRSQWKRERLAPSFHLDDENLDPRTWCRFPILAGGYKKELEELWRVAESQAMR